MNKTRLVGLIIVVIGFAIPYITNGVETGFFAGMLTGLGISLLVLGRLPFTGRKTS